MCIVLLRQTPISPFQGPQLCCFKVETVHFDIDIHTIGTNCPALKELHIVNARVKVAKTLSLLFP